MSSRSKAIVPHDGGETITIELPAYAVRYLATMCQRDRAMLNDFNALRPYTPGLDASFDALSQIEQALP
jgi:hypothetical protein